MEVTRRTVPCIWSAQDVNKAKCWSLNESCLLRSGRCTPLCLQEFNEERNQGFNNQNRCKRIEIRQTTNKHMTFVYTWHGLTAFMCKYCNHICRTVPHQPMAVLCVYGTWMYQNIEIKCKNSARHQLCKGWHSCIILRKQNTEILQTAFQQNRYKLTS